LGKSGSTDGQINPPNPTRFLAKGLIQDSIIKPKYGSGGFMLTLGDWLYFISGQKEIGPPTGNETSGLPFYFGLITAFFLPSDFKIFSFPIEKQAAPWGQKSGI
jgi:hypothetical protein